MKKISIKNKYKRRKVKLPLVSVVMPVYNAEKYLAQAIESILNQTYRRVELIIIDDQSSDKSNSIIKTYKRRHRNKIKLIETKKNLNGQEMCVNLGIESARGKYIARMDAGDIAVPQRLEKQVEFLERNRRVFLVGSSAYLINKNGKIIGEKLEPTSPSDIYHAYATSNPIISSSIVVRRIFGGKHFAYQIEYETNNDYYAFFKLVEKGYILANLSEKLLFFRLQDKNSAYFDIKEKFLNILRIRFNMIVHSNYKFTAKDIGINILQAIILFILPKNIVKNLFAPVKRPSPFVAALPV